MDINAQLAAHCCGTEAYYQLKHYPQVVLTDGIREAIRLKQQIAIMIDAIIELSQIKGSITEIQSEDMQFWKIRMNKDTMSEIILEDGNYNVVFRTEAPQAPFLVEDVSLDVFAAWTEMDGRDVCVFYLPSEH